MECKSKLRLHYIMDYINNILACILPEEFSVDVYSDRTHTHKYIRMDIYIYIYIYKV